MQCSGKDEFLQGLMPGYGGVKKGWANYNGNLEQKDTWLLDFKNLDKDPSAFIGEVWKYNRKNKDNIITVPVAGYEAPKAHWYDLFTGFFSSSARKRRTEDEFSESFSLSRFTTALNADVVLRVSKAAQFMNIVEDDDGIFLEVSSGVTIDEAEQFLDKEGYAFRPRMTTLHKATVAGAMAPGCYGPSDAPITSEIVELTVVKPNGKVIVLSAKKNAGRFSVLKDAHLGAGFFVIKIKMPIVPQFIMQRRNVLYQDVDDFAQGLLEKKWIEEKHYMAMYIPVDMDKEGEHFPRIRVTTLKRTDKSEKKLAICPKYSDVCDYFSLFRNEAGEPIIDLVTQTEQLRPYTPWLLKFAAMSTYGFDEDTKERGKSHKMYHPLRAYTDSIFDINWMIQIEDRDEARELQIELFDLAEKQLKEYEREDIYPLLNLFARYQGGVSYPEGEGGIAPTATDYEHQGILSFEFVTFMALSKTEAVRELIEIIKDYLNDRGNKFVYHPPKHMPHYIDSLTQMLTDDIGRKRLEIFQRAIIKMHGKKKDRTKDSPFLTRQKRKFIGLPPLKGEEMTECLEETRECECSKEQEAKALKRLKKEAKKNSHIVDTSSMIDLVNDQLKNL